jgi:phosphate transport system permease protein
MTSRAGLVARLQQRVAFILLWASLLAVTIPVIGILVVMIAKGAAGLGRQMLTSGSGGVLPALVGSILLVALTGLLAAPVGIAAAVYLSEYAKDGPLVRLIRLALVNLAAVPSVVYGLFGLTLFVTMLHFGRSLLSGACTLALLVLPLVVTASEEALRQVPRSLRQASWALGASRWQAIRTIVLPNALPGIMTGLILSIGRAAGETAPILFTAAFYSLTRPYPHSVFDGILALPYQLYVMATEVPHVPEATKWANALVLVLLVLGMNFAAVLFRSRLRRGRRW